MTIQKRMQDFYFEIESPDGKKEVLQGKTEQGDSQKKPAPKSKN